MELIRIGNDKLKIILTDTDMEKYNIDSQSFDYSDTESRRSFWSLMDDAKQSTGFNAAGSKIQVHMYPSRGGGCEIYVSRDTGVLNAELIPIRTTGSPSDVPIRINNLKKSRQLECRFDSLDQMISACLAVSRLDIICISEAYYTKGGYSLLLTLQDNYVYVYQNLFAVLSEFGNVNKCITQAEYYREHCKTICRNDAIGTLSGL